MKKRKQFIARAVALAAVISLAVSITPAIAAPIVTSDLATTPGLTAQALAQTLVGPGVSISNVTYTGANVAGGTFSGAGDVVGIDSGIILSSGNIANSKGPNTVSNKTTNNGQSGDADLNTFSGKTTYDAAVLQFDFVPNDSKLYMRYVFSSDEYNEYVGSSFNDVFAFMVNSTNFATVNGSPVSINTVNNGYGSTAATNPLFYIDNTSGALATEMDGLTKVLSLKAPVTPGQVNHMKLAIADASDSSFDSNVFIQTGSFQSGSPNSNLGLSVNKKKIAKGKGVIFKGILKDSSGQGLPFAKVLIKKKIIKKVKKKVKGKVKVVKKTIWKKVAQTTTDINGSYSKTVKLGATGQFKTQFAGDDDDKAAGSKVIKITVVVKKKK